MVQRSVTYRAELDGGTQVESGFRRIGKAGEDAGRQIERGQKSAEASAKTFERALAAEERGFRALKASVDPAYAAQLRFERAQTQVNRAVKMGVVSQREGAQVLAQFEAQARDAASAMGSIDTAGEDVDTGLRGVLQQVNQIGQQVAAGGDLVNSIAIQLPDILGSFGGILPLIAGAAVGLAAGIIPEFFATEEAAETAEDAVQAFVGALSAVQTHTARAQTGLLELREEFGRYAAEVRESARLAAEASVSIAFEKFGAASEAVRENVDSAMAAISDLARAQQQLMDAQDLGLPAAGIRASMTLMTQSALEALQALDLTAAEVVRLDAAFADLSAAQTMDEVAQAASKAVTLIRSMYTEGERMPGPIAQMVKHLDEMLRAAASGVRAMEDMTVSAGSAADNALRIKTITDATDISRIGAQAALLAEQMGFAADEAARYNRALNAAAGLPDSSAQPRLGFGLPGVTQTLDPLERPTTPLGFGDPSRMGYQRVRPYVEPPKTPRGTGGGAGASREQNQLDQEKLRIQQATTTALERYNAELALAQQLLDANKISQETYNRHVAATKAAYEAATRGANQFQRFVTMGKDAVINAVMGQKGAFEQLKQAIARAAIEYALFRTISGQPVTGGLGGLVSAFTGIFGSFEGGGYTGDGPRSGGLDGRGGMLAVVHPQETITDHRRARNAPGGRGSDMVPFVGIGDGVQVSWLKRADLRAASQLGSFAGAQRQNYGAIFGEWNMRGTL